MSAALHSPLLDRPDRARTASDYGLLLARVRHARLLDRSGLSYLPRAVVVVLAFAAGIGVFFWLGESWWQLAVAGYFAVVFTQIGFLSHDAGHQQVFARKRWNDVAGLLLSNLGVGLSFGWWVDKHNRHHSHPNTLDRDPDVERNILAWTRQQAVRQRGVFRFIARHQAAIFFPLLLLEAWNLHVGSARGLGARTSRRRLEAALLVVHAIAYAGLVLLVLSPWQAVAFVAVQQSLFGLYLGCSFAPNHKGMPILDGTESLDFFRRQVVTSRNVRGGRWLAVAFGGLTFQIEHHLFPSMPSRNLRRCQQIVKDFCLLRGVAYSEATLMDSYAQVLRYLQSVQPPTTPKRRVAANETL